MKKYQITLFLTAILMCSISCIQYKTTDTLEEAFNIKNGLTPVEKGGLWGYINADGKMLIKPQFEAADYFYEL